VDGFLILIVILGAIWALFVLPSKRRRNQHSAMQDSIETGDEIITAGGLHGIVVEMDEDTARIEIAPGVVVTLDRRAIAAVAREIEVEVEAEPEPDAEPEAEAEEQPEPEPAGDGHTETIPETPTEPR
jgi:preprotein translocase subunit YajC